MAAWNMNCELRLYRGRNSAANSCKKTLSTQLGFADSTHFLNVPARPIDDVVQELGVGVTVIKVDCGGAELDALEGLKHTMTKYRPLIFVDTQKAIQKQTLSFLSQQGYEILQSTSKSLSYGCFILVPKEIKEF
jgi:hypothetical protein